MTLSWLIAAILMTLAVIAHVAVGTRETATLEAACADPKQSANWVQSMCAFQMLTIDLIILTAVIYVLALTDIVPQPQLVAMALAWYFALQGILWIGNVVWLRRAGATLLTLPHWALWFICSGLLWFGI